jgi:hypothetical protein
LHAAAGAGGVAFRAGRKPGADREQQQLRWHSSTEAQPHAWPWQAWPDPTDPGAGIGTPSTANK